MDIFPDSTSRPVYADHEARWSPAADFAGKFPEGSVELWQLLIPSAMSKGLS
jgi:hypothetical protein